MQDVPITGGTTVGLDGGQDERVDTLLTVPSWLGAPVGGGIWLILDPPPPPQATKMAATPSSTAKPSKRNLGLTTPRAMVFIASRQPPFFPHYRFNTDSPVLLWACGRQMADVLDCRTADGGAKSRAMQAMHVRNAAAPPQKKRFIEISQFVVAIRRPAGVYTASHIRRKCMLTKVIG